MNTISDQLSLTFEQIENYILNHSRLSKEILLAKNQFFKTTGIIRDSDPSYLNRINAFLLWFIFEWKMDDNKLIPLHLILSSAEDEIKDFNFTLCHQLVPHVQSLFEFIKTHKVITHVKDVFSKIKYKVPDESCMIGVESGTFFETRLFVINETLCFSNYFIFHPKEVNKQILAQIKLIINRKDLVPKLLMKLHEFHTKWENYRNMEINYIYHFDKRYPKVK